MNPFTNFIAFQVGWFACVLGAANGRPWIGLAVTALVVTLHLVAVARPAREVRLIVAALAMGLVLDSLLVSAGWLSYANGQIAAGLAPYWILAMWALFATTLNVSMRWLRGKYVVATLFGLVGGPLSYLAGARLGAVHFVDNSAAIIVLGLGWAAAMPALMWLAERYDGIPTGQVNKSIQNWVTH